VGEHESKNYWGFAKKNFLTKEPQRDLQRLATDFTDCADFLFEGLKMKKYN